MNMAERSIGTFGTEISEQLRARLEEAEAIAKADKNTELWPRAMREEWDVVHGVIPHFAKDVCGWIGMEIEPQLPDIAALMAERHNTGGAQDRLRSYEEFTKQRLQNENPKSYEVTVGWFCEWFRLVDPGKRMSFSESPLSMIDRLGVTAKLLAWIEMLARLCVRQRLTAPSGLDLDGLAMRMMIVKEPTQWRMDMTIFLPTNPKKTSKSSHAAARWNQRAQRSAGAVRSLYAELKNIFEEEFFVIERRRLVFRPGYSISSVNAAKGVSAATGAFDIATAGKIVRRPEVLNLQYVIFDQIDPGVFANDKQTIRRPLATLRPTELLFSRQRQYHWHHSSAGESDMFTPAAFAMGLKLAGEVLQRGNPDDQGTVNFLRNEYIRSIDYGDYIPMQDSKFVQPAGFTALRSIVVPYVAVGDTRAVVATADLVANADYGLQAQLLRQDKPLLLHVNMEDDYAFELQEHLVQRLAQHEPKLDLSSRRRLLERIRIVVESIDSEDLGLSIEPKGLAIPREWR